MDESKEEIIKTKLSPKEALRTFIVTIIFSVIFIVFLYKFNDSNPIIDGITTIFSITGMYLTVKRAIEQWIVWSIVNAIAVIMWISIAKSGQPVCSTVVMWGVYLVLGIYFYFRWKKEV